MMKLTATFEHEITKEEMMRYICNEIPYEEIREMESDKLLELAAMSAAWLRHPKDDSIDDIINCASSDIADGIESFFWDEMWKNYYEYYNEEMLDGMKALYEATAEQGEENAE